MLNTGYFTTIAGLGVTISGFASLMYSFRGDRDLTRLTAWRIRYIVTGGFSLSAASIGVVAVAIVTEDPDLQVRVATVLALLAWVPSLWTFRSLKDREIFRSRSEAISWVVGGVAYEAVHVVNLVIASHRLLVILWTVMLVAAMSIFVSEVGDIYRTRDEAGAGGSPGGPTGS